MMQTITGSIPPTKIKTPVLDERRICANCGQPFRCPVAQIERFNCGPCKGKKL